MAHEQDANLQGGGNRIPTSYRILIPVYNSQVSNHLKLRFQGTESGSRLFIFLFFILFFCLKFD